MNTDFQDALSSVAEVATFAWSLLELFFTRILPLVGFLTGHVLMQCGALLVSVVTTPAASRSQSGRRKLRASTEYSYSWEELQTVQEEVIEEGDEVHAVTDDGHIWGVPQAKEVAQELEAKEGDQKVPVAMKEEEQEDDHQNSSTSESSKSSDEEHKEISQPKSAEKVPILLPSIAEDAEAAEAATAGEAALPTSAPPVGKVTACIDPGNEKPARGSDDMRVAISSPSNVQKVDLAPSAKHADEASKPAVGVAERQVSFKAEGRAGTSEKATRTARSGKIRKMSGGGALMHKSRSSRGSMSILRVLPPSLSQVERILRQRSRRVSFSQD